MATNQIHGFGQIWYVCRGLYNEHFCKILALIGPAVSEEKIFEECGRQMTEPVYTISSPMSLKAQVS